LPGHGFHIAVRSAPATTICRELAERAVRQCSQGAGGEQMTQDLAVLA
jgi:hypothetical protein